MAALDNETLTRLRQLTEDDLGMDALVEVHTREEIDRARNSGAKLIGVNNRNLGTFAVSLDTSAQLAPFAGDHALLISESGIDSAGDIHRLYDLGFRGFLIGESFMRKPDVEAAVRAMLVREAA